MDNDYGQETYCVRCSEGHVYCPICANALGIGINDNKERSDTWRCCCGNTNSAPMSKTDLMLMVSATATIKVVHHVEDMAVSLDHGANEASIQERCNMDLCQY